MASFRFRPAPARPARRVAHDAEGMSLDDGPWLPWSDLVELSFTVQSSRGVSFTTFRFKFSTQEAMLSMTGTPPEQHAFFHDMNRLLRDLAQARPEVEVRLGHVGGARIGMFLVGGAMGLVGLGLLLAASSWEPRAISPARSSWAVSALWRSSSEPALRCPTARAPNRAGSRCPILSVRSTAAPESA
ncbi:hypothetical protein roselon_02504 [Roseibacterium elongatum DSM 19469]|uniref:Uncharacterized protein n=1 Tax=Roseicyclus elongatus DSM 19469 TaxID=1294273 RepID=W8SQL0_9RHOB|nr:hypothetical protein [Roseibacterium elongatum]AHM04825.1 hypothetical protein roselon_02504 [Roseibacterium elongatum DSM 19469]